MKKFIILIKRTEVCLNSHDDLECDLEMGEGPYYKKLNDTVFIVYFNIGFDDSIIFNSREKKWEVNM